VWYQKRFHSGHVCTFEVLTAHPHALRLGLFFFAHQDPAEIRDLIIEITEFTVWVVFPRQ